MPISTPNKNKLYGWVLLSSVLCIAALFYGGVLKNNARREEPQKSLEAARSAEVAEMTKKVVGNLPLSAEENKKVSDLVEQILSLKNNPSLGKDERDKLLGPLNIELDELLNQYTLAKMPQTESNLLAIKIAKGAMKDYKTAHSGKITSDEYAISMIGISSYKIVDGVRIEKIADRNKDLAVEFEKEINKAWENIKKILPLSALKKITYFEPFVEPKREKEEGTETPVAGQTGGFINFVGGQAESILGINLRLRDPDLSVLSYVLCHEYGHVISLNSSQRDSKIGEDQTLEYQTPYEQMQFKENSYMKKFYDRFYKYVYDDQCADKEGYLFYLRHQSEFVSVYAASHYDDDFAESFAFFVVGEEAGFLTGEDRGNGREKIKFFEQFQELVELRDQIRALLQKNDIHPVRSTV
ncbi:MAG: hypothetical protein LBB04_02615 [Oscillospiraceae bacterium]|nr:hypothetical protein [Oscillospiraceae bacterium]